MPHHESTPGADPDTESVLAQALRLDGQSRKRLLRALTALDVSAGTPLPPPEALEAAEMAPDAVRAEVDDMLQESAGLTPRRRILALQALCEEFAGTPHEELLHNALQQLTSEHPAAVVAVTVQRIAYERPFYVVAGLLGLLALLAAGARGLGRLIF